MDTDNYCKNTSIDTISLAMTKKNKKANGASALRSSVG